MFLASVRRRTTMVLAVASFVGLSGNLVSGDEEKAIEPAAVQLGRPVEFERDVYPILEASCIACHNVATAENQLVLENVAAIIKGGSAGTTVVPGKPEESLLYRVAARVEEPVMPPWPNDVQAKKLTPEQLGILKQWILEGAAGGNSGKSVKMKWQAINNQLKAVFSVDIDPSGRFVAAGRGGLVTVYDLSAGNRQVSLADPELRDTDAEGKPLADTPPATHRDYVHAIAFHPQGNLIATSGYREVKLWKRTLTETAFRTSLPEQTTHATLSLDGSMIAASSAAPGAALLLAATGEVKATIDTEGQVVTALQFLSGEKPAVLVALADGRIQINDATSAELRHRSEPLASPVSALSAELSGARIAALSADGVVRLLTIAADTSAVTTAAEVKSEAGAIQKVIGAGASFVTVANNQKAEVWKTEDAGRLAVMDLPGPVQDVAVNAASDRAVFVLQDGQALLWSVKEPKQIAVLNQDLPGVRSVKQAENSKSQRDARSAVLKTKVEETEKEVTAQKEAATKAKTELDQAITAAAEAKKKLEEATAATAAARKALEAAPADEAAKKAVEAAEKAETAAKEASTAADSKQQLAQKSLDFANAAVVRAEQRVTDRKQQQMLAQQDAEAAAAALEAAKTAAAAVTVQSRFAGFVENGSVAVTADAAGLARLWKAADGAPVDVLPAAEGVADIQALISSGTMLNFITTTQLVARNALPEWKLDGTLGATAEQPESVFVDRVLSLAFSPDGKLLAAGGGEASRQGQLTLWNTSEKTLAKQFPDAHSDTVYGVEFSPDGKLLASASADKFAKVFDVETGKHVQSYEGHTHHVMDITWKADLTLLASAGADNAIKVWNAETGEQTRTIATYSKQVTSLSFVGLQDNMLSSSGDRRVFFHAASNGNPVREFKGSPDYVYRAATTPDGGLVAAGCEDGILRVWNGTDGNEVVSFKP